MAAEWIPCDRCGVYWESNFDMLRHRGNRACKAKQKGAVGCEVAGRRWADVQRTLASRLPSLYGYLRSVRTATLEAGSRPTWFIPWAPPQAEKVYLTVDVAVLLEELRRSDCLADAALGPLALASARERKAATEAIATIASVPLLRTDSWTRILRRVPVPWRPRYGEALTSRLVGHWKAGKQVAHTMVRAIRSRSFKGAKTEAAARRTIKKLVGLVRGISDGMPVAEAKLRARNWDQAADALPGTIGYTGMSWIRTLLQAANICPRAGGGEEEFSVNNIASGPKEAIARLTGTEVEGLDDAALNYFLGRVTEKVCRHFRESMTRGALAGHLCAWASDAKFGEEVSSNRGRVMRRTFTARGRRDPRALLTAAKSTSPSRPRGKRQLHLDGELDKYFKAARKA